MYRYIYIYIYIHTYTYTHICTYVHIHIHIHVCIHIYIYIYIHICIEVALAEMARLARRDSLSARLVCGWHCLNARRAVRKLIELWRTFTGVLAHGKSKPFWYCSRSHH